MANVHTTTAVHWAAYLVILTSFTIVCDALVCYKCSSDTLEACAMTLDDEGLTYEQCNDTATECVISVVKSITYRGCGNDTTITDASYLKFCSGNLCNKGVFPPGRLKCHHCNGFSCVPDLSTAKKPQPCRLHHEDDRCYTDVIDATKVYRGCHSDTNHTQTNSSTKYCDFNGCNYEAGARRLKCAQCNSLNGRGCKIDLFEVNAKECNITTYEICEVDTLLTKPETCFIYHKLNHVMRGCSKDLPKHLQAHENYQVNYDVDNGDYQLKLCHNGDYCNLSCLKRQKCIVCDSTYDGNACTTNITSFHPAICASAEASSCYASEYKNWTQIRGCGNVPKENVTDITRYYECDEEDDIGCNAKNFTRCYKCTSEKATSCANWERPDFDIEIEECNKPNAHCIRAAKNGVTLRGCESDFLHCNATITDIGSCETCIGSFCNRGQYPRSNLRCYQCEGTNSCSNALSKDPMPCPVLPYQPTNEIENCFHYLNSSAGNEIRGCKYANAEKYYQCMLQNGGANCHICNTDGCNRR